MQIYPKKSKKGYLELVDNALLYENSYLGLIKLIEENCLIFKD